MNVPTRSSGIILVATASKTMSYDSINSVSSGSPGRTLMISQSLSPLNMFQRMQSVFCLYLGCSWGATPLSHGKFNCCIHGRQAQGIRLIAADPTPRSGSTQMLYLERKLLCFVSFLSLNFWLKWMVLILRPSNGTSSFLNDM